jgi:ribose transport system substrate-binding protein
MKKLSLIIALLATLFALTSCQGKTEDGTQGTESSGENSSAEGEIHLAYVPWDTSNPYWVSVIQGLQERADELGVQLTVVDPQNDLATQVSQIENLITAKVDAILISPIDAAGVTDAVTKAQNAGIPTLGMNTPIDIAWANYTLNEYEYGYNGGELAAEWINEKFVGEKSVEVALLISPNVTQLIEREKGLREGILKNAPNAVIVAEQAGNDVSLGANAAETILTNHPNVKVIAAVNDAGALGALEIVNQKNEIDKTNFYIGGLDATTEALEKMELKDSVYRATVDISPIQFGKDCLDAGVKLAKEGQSAFDEILYMHQIPLKQTAWK